MRVVGLMSGTSLDGIDAALIEIDGTEDGDEIAWRLVAFDTLPYPRGRREEIHDAILEGDAAHLARTHARLGEWFAEAVLRVCRAADVSLRDVDLVGSHGQTVWHQPPREGMRGSTLQLGCPATIAERTGIDVVSDFRSRDMAAGGEGAPLVSWVDQLLFTADHVRILQNIGGMANLTRLPPRGSDVPIIAFDTGPGNALIDTAVELATNGELTFDAEGGWARRGAVDEAFLAELMEDPFFHRAPPKSTGREAYGRAYVQTLVERRRPADRDGWADLIATLTALTAATIAEGVRRWADPGEAGEVLVSGGGGRNPALVEMLRSRLDPVPVRTGDALGFPPEAKEAIAFAVLAWAHAMGRPGNVPEVTGASGARVLGSYTPGRGPGRHRLHDDRTPEDR
ncbi:MAG TPA: anhydro-N-acetylmuramic acid kinase [Longimicrobiales bacterium]|nr:anhydro-N-acetylmuramic acid kinase [Longimicrobiales bacterium]